MAPRKVRLAADVIRGKRVPEAEAALRFLTRRAAHPLLKLLRSGVANARANFQAADPAELVVAEVRVDGGPAIKRSRPRAFGRAFPIRKRTSHVTLVLESRGAPPKRARPAVAVATAEPGGEETRRAPAPKWGGLPAPKPKIATKPTDFVRRMFRRKAI